MGEEGDVRRYQPLRRIDEKRLLPTLDQPWSVGQALGGQPHEPIDILECGHVLSAKLLMPASKTPYVRKHGETYRKCPECPRVEEVS